MNDSQQMITPIARKEGLVIQELPNEVLVYDLNTNKAHCLNQTAAAVWKSCDGKNTVADISKFVNRQTGDASLQEDLIWLAIDQLSEKNLLEQTRAPKFSGQTRREVIKKVGLAAVVALPIVTSLVAPTVASAGSTCANPACTCTLGAACPTGTTCPCSTSAGSGTSNCPSQCTGGCSCTVQGGATSCNSRCG